MRFIGVDLGWKMDPPRPGGTGLCQVDQEGMVLLATTVTEIREIVDTVRDAGESWVGIDASLIVHNQEGSRPCERRLREMGIRVLPTNRSFLQRRFGGSRGEGLVERLADLDFVISSGDMDGRRLVFEVFPHGTLHLLSGGRRPDYKRGGREVRAEGRRQVIDLVKRWEPRIEVPAVLLGGGLQDKEAEDVLDAWVCVACVYSHWLNGGRTTRMVGEEGDGHILLGCQRHE